MESSPEAPNVRLHPAAPPRDASTMPVADTEKNDSTHLTGKDAPSEPTFPEGGLKGWLTVLGGCVSYPAKYVEVLLN